MSTWPKGLPHSSAEVVVVGAGAAGLSAAHHLAEAGVDVMILEANSRVGGRMVTDEVDGFLLDRGFQLYNPAYPAGARLLDYEALDLRSFFPGAVLQTEAGPRWLVDPRRATRSSARNWRTPLGVRGTVQTLRYFAGCAVTDPTELQQRPDLSTREAFRAAHISDKAVSRLLQPFLAGVLADEDLVTSRRFTDLVLRSLVRGTPAVPASGMQAIPEQLAKPLRSRIFRDTPVVSIAPDSVATEGGSISCEAVVLAVDPTAASRLWPQVPKASMRALTTWYFSIEEDDLFGGKAVLTLDARKRGPVTNTVVLSYAAPSYAPDGQHLVQATAVGLHDEDPTQVRHHLAELYGIPTGHWRMVGHYPIAEALPSAVAPFTTRGTQEFGGVVVAGDHRDTPSIQGALASGKRAAAAVRHRLA